MSVIDFGSAEQGSQRVVARNDEASKVGQQLTAEIEHNEEEVERDEANDSINLWNRRLLFKIGESGVFSQLQMRSQSLFYLKERKASHVVCAKECDTHD